MRRSSQHAYFFGVAAAILAAVPAWPAAPAPLPPAADRDLGRSILKELVEIRTTHDRGSTEAAHTIEQHLLRAGFPASDVIFVAPPEHPTKGNLVVRYRAKAGRGATLKPVLFLGHLDVVEALAQDWSVDPFLLTEKDGFFYGRGTIDMKDADAAMLESLIRLRREHYTPPRDLIVAFTADEEAGGDANGPAFLLRDHRELIDADFAINLDGGGGTLRNGGRGEYEVGTAEKTYVTYTIETTGPGGHGSLPGPDNPIYRIAAALSRLEAFKFPVALNSTTRATFQALAALHPGPGSADMLAVAQAEPDPAAAERLSADVGFNALLRTTCVATLISGGHAENALPQRAKATIQCRMLPGDTAEHVQTALVQTIGDPRITLTQDAPPIVSPESPLTPKIRALAERVVHSMWPKVPIVPSMSTGFSDDRQTRNAGIPSYDLSGDWSEAGENRAHGRDERVSVQSFDESVEYTFRLMKEAVRLKP